METVKNKDAVVFPVEETEEAAVPLEDLEDQIAMETSNDEETVAKIGVVRPPPGIIVDPIEPPRPPPPPKNEDGKIEH